MLTNPLFSPLFAACPIWLWPVLVWSLLSLSEEILELHLDGETWFELRLTPSGRAYIARAPASPLPTWKDDLFRAVMGDPVPDPEPETPKLGIVTAEAQVDWAFEQFGDGAGRSAELAPANAALAHAAGRPHGWLAICGDTATAAPALASHGVRPPP